MFSSGDRRGRWSWVVLAAEINAALGSKHLEEQKHSDLISWSMAYKSSRACGDFRRVHRAGRRQGRLARISQHHRGADRRLAGSPLRGSVPYRLSVADGFGAPRAIQVDDPCFGFGFYPAEREGDAMWRWTTGRARLPAKLWDGVYDTGFLRIDFARSMPPR